MGTLMRQHPLLYGEHSLCAYGNSDDHSYHHTDTDLNIDGNSDDHSYHHTNTDLNIDGNTTPNHDAYTYSDPHHTDRGVYRCPKRWVDRGEIWVSE